MTDYKQQFDAVMEQLGGKKHRETYDEKFKKKVEEVKKRMVGADDYKTMYDYYEGMGLKERAMRRIREIAEWELEMEGL